MSYKFADGVLCGDCLKLTTYTLASPIKKITIDDVKQNIAKQNENKIAVQAFNPTKVIGGYIQFDEEKRQWLVPDGFGGKVKIPKYISLKILLNMSFLKMEIQ